MPQRTMCIFDQWLKLTIRIACACMEIAGAGNEVGAFKLSAEEHSGRVISF